ncbi:MAG: glycosyltransferase family 4 protein [Erysipelotrichaceae bacterium]|nr:glycosyltransferase family 4 protein [Erysipelotrichaceae bacterium]
MINSNYDGCCYPRIYLPCVYNGYWTDKPTPRADRIDIEEIKKQLDNADVVVFHRAEEQTYHDLAKLLKKMGKKIVMDNDDTFMLEDFHPLAQFTPDGKFQENLQRRQDNINEFMKICDLVTCSTETLKKEYSEHNDNVIVLPNCVDPEDWDKPLRNDGDKVRIGIVGSAALEYDYLHIKPLIKELSERDDVELVLFGLGDLKHQKENPKVTKVFKDEYEFWNNIKMTQFPWCKRADYNKVLNEARLDIMLIPRRDNYFNRCKSNIKFLEASMCEIPVIAQSFESGPYEEITDDMGVLIKDNSKWKEELERLIKDKDLRRSMGKKAKEYVIKNYNIEDKAHLWADAYNKLCEL